MTRPFITVIIPTRERCDTLGPTIRTCVEQNYDAFEILISDNQSNDRTRDVVHAFDDKRIRYLNTGKRLSMSGNFEFALDHVRPGIAVSIGDDDGLMPGAIEKAASYFQKTKTKALTSSSVYYTWPNFPIPEQKNRMLIRDRRSGMIRMDARTEASERIACRTKDHLYVWGLPSIYRAFVSTDVLAQARSGGRYFHSITPDAYSAFVNSFFVGEYLHLHEPLTIEGVSARSNGSAQLDAKDSSEEVSYLKENDIAFNEDLVYAPATPIILAEAFLQARTRFPELAAGYDVDFRNVCRAALREAKGGSNEERVRIAVEQICARQNIDELGSIPLLDRLTRSWNLLADTYHRAEVDCQLFGVKDVCDAAHLADRILTGSTHLDPTSYGAGLVGRKIARKLKRAISA